MPLIPLPQSWAPPINISIAEPANSSPLELDSLKVYPNHLVIDGVEYPCAKVTEIFWYHKYVTIIGTRADDEDVFLHFSYGQKRFEKDYRPLLFASMRRSTPSVMNSIYRHLARASFPNRVESYEKVFLETGIFRWQGVGFCRNSLIQYAGEDYPFSECKFSRTYRHLILDIPNRKTGFFQPKRIKLEIPRRIDSDCLDAMLAHYFGLRWNENGA
jgi:hypothetical protein